MEFYDEEFDPDPLLQQAQEGYEEMLETENFVLKVALTVVSFIAVSLALILIYK